MTDIKIIHGLLGRTIVEAVTDGETMSIKLDDRSILQIAFIGSTGTLHYEIEHSLCSQGIHSWCSSTESFAPDYRCEWCGEEYGNVKDNHLRLGYTDPNDPDLTDHADEHLTEFMAWWKGHPQYATYGDAINHFYDDMAQHMDEQSLAHFNRYMAGDRR